MKMVFQQKVQEKEAKLKQSEEELYARHKEMKDALDKQRADLEDKKKKIESGRPLTPDKNSVRLVLLSILSTHFLTLFLFHSRAAKVVVDSSALEKACEWFRFLTSSYLESIIDAPRTLPLVFYYRTNPFSF